MLARVGDIVMNFEIRGRGPPLMLISDIGVDLTAWSLQIPSFALNYMTIYLDNRGTGKSDAPDKPYSIPMMANDTSRLLDVIGAESTNLVGVGMGARIALEMALQHPTKVNGLVIGSSGAKATPPEIEVLRTVHQGLANGLGKERLTRYEIPWLLGEHYFEDSRVTEGAVKVRMAKISGTPDYARALQIQALLDYDCTSRLGQLRSPTLVLGGKQDRLVPIQYQEEMASAIPGSRFKALEAAHMTWLEAAKQFNEETLLFLAEQNF